MAMPINPGASNAIVAASDGGVDQVKIGYPPAMRIGGVTRCDDPREAVAREISGGVGSGNKVDLVDRRRGAVSRVEGLRSRRSPGLVHGSFPLAHKSVHRYIVRNIAL
jgi:hypothetical protein